MKHWLFSFCLLAWLASCAVPTSSDELQRFLDETRGATAPEWNELWILDREPDPAPVSAPGFVVPRGAEDPEITETVVEAQVLGRLASVEVRQTCTNASDVAASVEYRLPLPTGAAVTDFAIRYGDRHIRAVVREREQAERLYLAARQRGLLTRMVTRSADGYRQQLGSLPAASSIVIETRYLQPISHRDAWCYFDLPAAGHGGADVRIEVNAGIPIADVQAGPGFSLEQPASHRLVLTQPRTASRPARDVRWRVLTQGHAGALFVATDARDGSRWFLLTTYGPCPSVDWHDAIPQLALPRIRPGGSAAVTVGKLAGDGSQAPEFATGNQPLRVQDVSDHARTLARAWATLQIDELARRAREAGGNADLQSIADEMRAVAMQYGVPSYVTSALLVDAGSR